jgi:hypothetical protein
MSFADNQRVELAPLKEANALGLHGERRRSIDVNVNVM